MTVSRFRSLNQRFEPAAAADAQNTLWPALYNEGLVDLSPQDWSLEITGLVGTAKTWQYDDVLALPQTEQNRRLSFAEGWSYRATWRGVLLSDLLQQAEPAAEARFVIQQNAMGQQECLPLQACHDGQVLLGLFEGTAPLSVVHGGPARLMIFDRYANYGLGQLVRLELSAEPTPGYWEAHGYTPEIEPGSDYAFDQQQVHTRQQAGETTQY